MPEASSKKVILILEANPQGTAALEGMEEVRVIRELIEHRRLGGEFELVPYPRVTRNNFVAAIGRYKPAIVHFIGHADSNALCLENERGHLDLITHQDVIDVLRDYADNIDCVVFNACDTQRHALAAAEFIPAVVGTCGSVETATAARYAERFYQGYFDTDSFQRGHRQVEVALGNEVDIYQLHSTPREKLNQLKALKEIWLDYKRLRCFFEEVVFQNDELRAFCKQCFPVGQMGPFPRTNQMVEVIDWIAGRSLLGFNPPLLHLLALIKDQLCEDDKKFINSWLEDACADINLSPLDLVPHPMLPAIEEQNTPIYVLIEIAPVQVNSNHCTAQVWIYLGKNTESILTRDANEAIDLSSEESKSQFTDDLVEALSESEYLPHSNHEQVVLEFILPLSMLSLDIDQWSDHDQQVLGNDYRILVRPQERIRRKRLQRFWKPIPPDMMQLNDCSQIIDSEESWKLNHEQLLSDAKENKHSVIFKFSPKDHDLLAGYIRKGLPVLLWPRMSSQDLEKGFCMKEMFGSQFLPDLPKRVLEARSRNSNQIGRHLTLLWDDKDRLPPAVKLQSPG